MIEVQDKQQPYQTQLKSQNNEHLKRVLNGYQDGDQFVHL